MHELAIAESVIDAVTARAGTARVSRVRLEIGKLSGVSTSALRFSFDLAADGTTLAGCALDITEPPGRARCNTCGNEFPVSDFVLLCSCGSADVQVLSGQQLRILSVETAVGVG